MGSERKPGQSERNPGQSGRGRAADRLAALADRYDLSEAATAQIQALLAVLTSDPRAPTTVRDPKRALDDHLADSLVALELPEVRSASSIADLGAGAGVPGLPLAIAIPTAQVVLVESNGRKCDFIRRAIEACGADNASVACTRAEAWPDGLTHFDLVTARALAPLPVVAEYAAPLLRVGGAALVWRGRRDQAEEAAAAHAADELGLRVLAPVRVTPYGGAINRHLQLMIKDAPTPSQFPRRPGMARKRPLGGGGSGASGRTGAADGSDASGRTGAGEACGASGRPRAGEGSGGGV
ncbi:MAG TPA: 16S rRNA (guanine(527)-N(7))-methyltransferase RsmG [Solirubrobacteraceae bacterium]